MRAGVKEEEEVERSEQGAPEKGKEKTIARGEREQSCLASDGRQTFHRRSASHLVDGDAIPHACCIESSKLCARDAEDAKEQSKSESTIDCPLSIKKKDAEGLFDLFLFLSLHASNSSAPPFDLPLASGFVHRFTSRIESLEKVLSCSPRSILAAVFLFCFFSFFFFFSKERD